MTFNPLSIYTALIRNPKTKWVTFVLTILYVISPVDIIPDFLLPFGIIDDGILLTFLIIALKEIRPKKHIDAKFR
jgi:uncharacterized membrane protein YkvA (DUF1232 family)